MKAMQRHNWSTARISLHVSIFFAVCAVICSCSVSFSDEAYIKAVDTSDVHAQRGSKDAAVRELDRISKKIYRPLHALGAVRRYLSLNEPEKALAVINCAVEQNPQNLELRAVLTWIYSSVQRFDEASAAGAVLENTAYDSIVTAVNLRKLVNTENKYGTAAVGLYHKAFLHTGSLPYLRNAAVLHASQGRYDDALKLLESVPISRADDILMRSYILYDSGKYQQCRNVLQEAVPFAADSLEAAVLQADCAVLVNDLKAASVLWEKIIAVNADYSSAVLVNAAKAAGERGEAAAQKKHLEAAVELFPLYEPALAAYARFATLSSDERQEDAVTRAVRTAGYVSLEMAAYDETPRINPSDALQKLSQFLEKKQVPMMQIEKVRLQWHSSKIYDSRRKINDIWALLEQESKDGFAYDSALVNYAMYLLVSDKKYEEAQRMLDAYILQNHGSFAVFERAGADNWNDAREFEYAPYLAAVYTNDYEKAAALYQTAYDKQGKSFPTVSLMNYASVCRTIGQADKAVGLLTQAARRSESNMMKSEIHYRLGCLLYEKGDAENGMINLDYSVQLDNSNTKARLLLKKKAVSAQ